ncbi:MAG: CFI-box-CTERM domain-containing protein [Nitrosopumilaceae archaeon]
MKFISIKSSLSTVCTLALLFTIVSLVPFEAHGDGLAQENLPPASIGDRQASLFIKISPPILTSETVQDTFLQLRLFDANNNQTIQHTSFFITVRKNNDLLMRDLFHTHSGLLTIKIEPTNTPGKWQTFGDIEPFQGGWTSVNDQLSVQAPILLEGGLYHFEIEIFGIDNDRNIFIPADAPRFDSWLSVGDIYHNTITYQAKSYDTTIISYYDKIKDFKFDESKNLISYSMPFNWDMSRIEGQNIFVHEEIQIPKSFKEFTDSITFNAKVNGVPLVGRMLAIDPYSKEDTLILHYLINKNDILDMSKKISPDTKTMDFILSPGDVDAQTATEILTDFGGFRAELGWSPTDLTANTKTDLTIAFFDAFSGKQVAGDVKYDLKILAKNGNSVFSETNLDAIGAMDSQPINFASNGIYTLEIDIKSITINGKTDSSRLGIARGYIVIPSTVTAQPITCNPPQILENGICVNPPPITCNPPQILENGICVNPPQNKCLIATAAFGSELAPQVQQLRETRDNVVMQTQSGAAFMTAFNAVYYSFAPTVAGWENQNPLFREVVKTSITPLITTLSILNYVNIGSDAEMLGYGISVILLNIGMYFVAPAIVIMRLRHYTQDK